MTKKWLHVSVCDSGINNLKMLSIVMYKYSKECIYRTSMKVSIKWRMFHNTLLLAPSTFSLKKNVCHDCVWYDEHLGRIYQKFKIFDLGSYFCLWLKINFTTKRLIYSYFDTCCLQNYPMLSQESLDQAGLLGLLCYIFHADIPNMGTIFNFFFNLV